MTRRWILPATTLFLAALLSCAREGPFVPGNYSVSGNVKVRGFYLDRDGNFAGTRILGDADGVPVDLLYGTQVLAHTTSQDGSYRFDKVHPGGYAVRVRILPGVEWTIDDVVVVNRDVAVGDTLMPTSIGSMFPVPNPFVDAMTAYIPVDDTTDARVALLDLSGRLIQTFFDHPVLPALYQVSVSFPPLPAGSAPTYYWLTYSAGADVRAQLLVRESAVAPAGAAHGTGQALRHDTYPGASALAQFRVIPLPPGSRTFR